MSECWFKHHEGMIDDAKWDLVAEIAEVPLSLVAIGWGKLLEFAAKQDDRGSIAGFDPRLISARFKEYTADQVRRMLAALREVGSIVGERIAAWVRRGNPARFVEAAVNDNAPRSARKSTPRTRKHRAERRAESRQLSLLLPMSGNAGTGVPDVPGPVPVPETPPKNDVVPTGSTASLDLEGESEREKKESSKNLKVVPGGRCAPLEADPPSPEHVAWVKQRRRDLLQQKLFRFINATMTGREAEAAYAGLMAGEHDEAQRWFDRLDNEMRARRWNDARVEA